MKLAFITDLHYASTKNIYCPERSGELAKQLLEKAVDRLNRSIQPDLLILGGDLVNDPADIALLQELAKVLEKVGCPCFAIPGNHDPEPGIFYQYFSPLPDSLDMGGIRFMAFPEDRQTAGYNACRSSEDLKRIAENSHDLPVVMIQHVPLFKPGTLNCIYNYDNAEEIFAVSGNVTVSLSGHYHSGYSPSDDSPFTTIAVPALCEGKFPFAVMELDQNGKLTSYQLHYLAE